MRFYRAVMLWFSSIVLHGTLLLIIASISIYFLFGNRNAAKEAFVDSGIYNEFVSAVLEENQDASTTTVSSLPLNDPEIQKIARQAFSPQALRRETEVVVDSVYDWLDEKSTRIEFDVSFVEEKTVFVELASTYAAQRLEALPSCGDRDISMIAIFSLDCRPEYVSSAYIKDKVADDLNNAEFFKSMRYTQDSLPLTANGKSLSDQYAFVPQLLQTIKNSLWLFVIVFLLACSLYIVIRRPFNKGMRSFGRDLVTNSGALLLATIVFGFILPRYTDNFAIKGTGTSDLFNRLFETYIHRFDIIIINITLQVAIIGVLILMLEKFSRPSKYHNVKKKSGLTSSYEKKKVQGKLVRKQMPPVQSSEVPKVRPRKAKKVPKQYRKIGIE
jgi:hypothetical protein